MIYRLFEPLWFWMSKFFEEHPEVMNDWACQCDLCMSYAVEDRE
jgi:hypothetical protein